MLSPFFSTRLISFASRLGIVLALDLSRSRHKSNLPNSYCTTTIMFIVRVSYTQTVQKMSKVSL